MKFAANLGFLYADRPLLARIGAAAADGFEAVEMHWPYEHAPQAVKSALDQANLPLLGINTFPGARPGDFGLAGIPGREADFMETFQQSLTYARALGGNAIHCMAGVGDSAAGDKVLRTNLDRAAELAASHGIMILIEPINQRDRPGYMLRNTAHALAIIGDIQRANLKLMFDCYHVQVTEGDVCKRLEAAFPHVGHVQIAACPSRQEPDSGELNYRYVLSQLKAMGYDGWIGAEYKPKGKTEDGLGWLAPWKAEFSI